MEPGWPVLYPKSPPAASPGRPWQPHQHWGWHLWTDTASEQPLRTAKVTEVPLPHTHLPIRVIRNLINLHSALHQDLPGRGSHRLSTQGTFSGLKSVRNGHRRSSFSGTLSVKWAPLPPSPEETGGSLEACLMLYTGGVHKKAFQEERKGERRARRQLISTASPQCP